MDFDSQEASDSLCGYRGIRSLIRNKRLLIG